MRIHDLGIHNESYHHVTKCIHEHGQTMAGAEMRSAAGAESEAVRGQQQSESEPMGWLERLRETGKRAMGFLWGGQGNSASGEPRGSEELRETGATAALAGMSAQSPERNPYFTTADPGAERRQTIWSRFRVRFQDIAGHLNRNSFRNQSFQRRREGAPRDLRKHSRYRDEDVEMDCILKDDSYLLDSYDNRGEYSRLTVLMRFPHTRVKK